MLLDMDLLFCIWVYNCSKAIAENLSFPHWIVLAILWIIYHWYICVSTSWLFCSLHLSILMSTLHYLDFCIFTCMCIQSLQSWPPLCSSVDSSPLGSSVYGIVQVRRLKWVIMPSSRESSRPQNQTHFSCVSSISGKFFTHWAKREDPYMMP